MSAKRHAVKKQKPIQSRSSPTISIHTFWVSNIRQRERGTHTHLLGCRSGIGHFRFENCRISPLLETGNTHRLFHIRRRIINDMVEYWPVIHFLLCVLCIIYGPFCMMIYDEWLSSEQQTAKPATSSFYVSVGTCRSPDATIRVRVRRIIRWNLDRMCAVDDCGVRDGYGRSGTLESAPYVTSLYSPHCISSVCVFVCIFKVQSIYVFYVERNPYQQYSCAPSEYCKNINSNIETESNELTERREWTKTNQRHRQWWPFTYRNRRRSSNSTTNNNNKDMK